MTYRNRRTSGYLLASVDSWADAQGIHPLDGAGIPILTKAETVPYSEIEFIEFTEMMTTKDAATYRVVMNEYVPNSGFALVQ